MKDSILKYLKRSKARTEGKVKINKQTKKQNKIKTPNTINKEQSQLSALKQYNWVSKANKKCPKIPKQREYHV